MPLRWTFDDSRRLVTCIADGDVTRVEFEHFLAEMVAADALGWRKLFDGTDGETRMGADDLLAIAVAIRSHHTKPVGPLAVVVSPDKIPPIARVLGALAAAKRPMRVFHEVAPAREWLRTLTAAKRSD